MSTRVRALLPPPSKPDRRVAIRTSTGGDSKHDHLVFTMSGGAVVTFNDARQFGYMILVPEADLSSNRFFHGLGVEPLGDDLDAGISGAARARRKVDLKAFLMDQRNVAGLGNIYVCEALFRAGLSPWKIASRLATPGGKPAPAAERLIVAIKAVLRRYPGRRLDVARLQTGRRQPGSFQKEFGVYGREGEPCARPGCRGTVRRRPRAGAQRFYCPTCQR